MVRQRAFFVAVLLIVVTAAGLSGSSGSVFSAPPAGVTADEWHPISETLGLAVRHERNVHGQRELVGTLMIKEGNGWQSVNVSPNPVGMVPAR